MLADLGLPRIVIIVHTDYLNVHNKGQLFGYFIASSYFSSLFGDLLLV